ncbi:MAG: pentapeptide repeat-containing protein [Rivularia sp. (in: cyanobacteria)]
MDEFEEMLRLNALEEEIIKRYEAGERNFAGIDLRFINISYSCFLDTNFSDTNLECSSISGTDFINANFSGANLEWSYLPNLLINSNLSNTNLQKAKWRGATFVNVDMTGADLTGADLTSRKTTKLIGCDLRNANLADIKIDESVVLVSTIMPDGSIRTDSTKQIIDAQQLRQRFYREWQDNFQGIIMHDADLSGIDLHGTWMYPLNMSEAYFSNVNFMNADLSGIDFNRSSFICCNFRGANLESANLEGAVFISVDFTEANLIGAGTNLIRCILVNFQGANGSIYGYFYVNTILPDGRYIPILIIDV